jgi:hypothetical protein
MVVKMVIIVVTPIRIPRVVKAERILWDFRAIQAMTKYSPKRENLSNMF